MKRTNTVSHVGRFGSTFKQRIQKYSVYDVGRIGENIAQEITSVRRNHGLETVVSLIVDDGVYDRGHRKSLFTREFRYVGISTQRGPSHYFTVINLSSQNMRLRGARGGPRRGRRVLSRPSRVRRGRARPRVVRRRPAKRRAVRRANRPVQARRHPYSYHSPHYGFGWHPHPYFY